MDDLDRTLSRIAASTRSHADASVDIDEARASTLTRSASAATVPAPSDERIPRMWRIAGAAALIGLLGGGFWLLAAPGDRDRLEQVSPVDTATTESVEAVPTSTDREVATATTVPTPSMQPAPSVASNSDAGRLIDIDEMAHATEQLALPDTAPDLTLDLDNGVSLVVELSFAPGQIAEMVCVNNYVDDVSTGRTCGDPNEIGGLLTFGLAGPDRLVAVLSNIDVPIGFETSTCAQQWITEAAPFKLEVCEAAGEFATLNGRDISGESARVELGLWPPDAATTPITTAPPLESEAEIPFGDIAATISGSETRKLVAAGVGADGNDWWATTWSRVLESGNTYFCVGSPTGASCHDDATLPSPTPVAFLSLGGWPPEFVALVDTNVTVLDVMINGESVPFDQVALDIPSGRSIVAIPIPNRSVDISVAFVADGEQGSLDVPYAGEYERTEPGLLPNGSAPRPDYGPAPGMQVGDTTTATRSEPSTTSAASAGP